MFGLSFPKLALVGIVAVFIIGPERLPQFAARLASLVKTVRSFADSARDRVREEMGPDFDDIDWQKLDPRQYDPRRIIREALLDDGDSDSDEPVAVVKPAKKARAESDDDEPDNTASAKEAPVVEPAVEPADEIDYATTYAITHADEDDEDDDEASTTIDAADAVDGEKGSQAA